MRKVRSMLWMTILSLVSGLFMAAGARAAYLDHGNGTVTDTVTGLIWQQADDGIYRTWQQALAYCEGLNLAGHSDWRLPNMRELESLVDEGRWNPAIDPLFQCRSDYYWSSSTGAFGPYGPGGAWYVHFASGHASWFAKYDYFCVRCVRGGPSGPFDPLTIAQGPMSGSPGEIFVQWGDGFTPNTTATLHFRKPDGMEYPTAPQPIDSNGHFEIRYKIPSGKPVGTHTWWAIDGSTGKKSNEVSYEITAISGVAKVYGKLHVNSATGPALSGAQVIWGTKTATTASNGNFSLAKIPAGDQVLSFSKSGYEPFSITVPVPTSGSYNVGNRWLVQNGLVKPTIDQAPKSGPPGTTFTQWGTGFTPDKTATLHFRKPDGSEYPRATVQLDSIGHLEIPYRTPMNKPAGTYTWWAIDDATKKKSNEISYEVTQPESKCGATDKVSRGLMKIDNPTCREKWNMAIFYLERYNGWLKMDQEIIQDKIQGKLTTNEWVNNVIDGISSAISIYQLPSLKGKHIETLFRIGAGESLKFEAKMLDNEYAELLFDTASAAAAAASGDQVKVITYGATTIFSTINNLMTTIGISTLTKRFQEIEITKNFLFDFYRWGSRMNLMAADYGLPSNASMIQIIKAVGDQIGASNSWYWFDDYDVNRIVDLVILNMNIVSMKQAKYSN